MEDYVGIECERSLERKMKNKIAADDRGWISRDWIELVMVLSLDGVDAASWLAQAMIK